MGESIKVMIVTFTSAAVHELARGLVGWVSIQIGLLLVDGIAVRRSQNGRLYLAFPSPTDRRGRRREVVRPLDTHARRVIEAAVLNALEAQGEPR